MGLLLFVSQINLDLIHLLQNLPDIVIGFGSQNFKVLPVVGFMDEHILFYVGQVNVDFCNADFKMDPDGDEADNKSGDADYL